MTAAIADRATATRKQRGKTAEATSPAEGNAAPAFTPAVDAYEKIQRAKREFAKSFVERDDELDLILVGLIAGENVLLVGPPGTAKSMLCDAIHELVGGEHFTALLNKFTAPEELFGPPNLKLLEQGEYVRNVDGFLPTAGTAFLDEIFKAGPGILNTLLKILNERTFKNGRQVVPCPLEFAIAASNEFPGGENAGELSALFDRFAIRKLVKPVHTAKGRDQLMFGDLSRSAVDQLTPEELRAARDEAAGIPFSKAAKQAMVEILRELSKAGINPGDRRTRKAVGIARAWAWLEAASEVEPHHLEVLSHVLWDDPSEHPRKAAEVIKKVSNPGGAVIAEKVIAAEAIVAKADMNSMESLVKAQKELGAIVSDLKKITGDKAAEAARRVEAERQKLIQGALEASR